MTMHDYIVGAMMRDRQAGYLREVEHAELVAEAKRATSEAPKGPAAPPSKGDHRSGEHGWRVRPAHLRMPRLHLPLHHA
jgi:hypothetical protein